MERSHGPVSGSCSGNGCVGRMFQENGRCIRSQDSGQGVYQGADDGDCHNGAEPLPEHIYQRALVCEGRPEW